LETTLKLYRAELAPVDFVKAPEDSRLKINNWVEEQTAGRKSRMNPLNPELLGLSAPSIWP